MEHESKESQPEEFPQEKKRKATPAKETKTAKKKHPFRWFFVFLLVVLGALYVQQWFLDLEAEAIIYARQTASAVVASPEATQTAVEKVIPSATFTITPLPATETVDPVMVHTATVAAQLTDVAAFQQTQTPNP